MQPGATTANTDNVVFSLPPVLNGASELADIATAQTLTNKTISGASNTISNVSLTSQVTGVLPAGNGGTGIANNAAATTTRVGNYAKTETLTGITSVTYPTSGTLATRSGAETITGKTFDDEIHLKQISTPSTPASGYNKIYPKADGLLYKLDSSGNEVLVGSGAGAGELNLVLNPDADTALDGNRTNDVGDWIDSGTGTTSTRTTDAAEIPLSPLKTNAIRILNDGSSTGYTYMRMTLPTSLYSRKLKIAWEQLVSTSTAYVSGDFKVELYTNAASDYSGAYTAVSLSTDSSGVSSIPAANGRFQTTFDASTAPYLELRITRVNGAANSYISLNNVVVGPGVQPQGAVVGPVQQYSATVSPISGFSENPTINYYRDGEELVARGHFRKDGSAGVGAARLAISLPPSLTINGSAVSLNGARLGGLTVAGASGFIGGIEYDSASTTTVGFTNGSGVALVGTDVAASAEFYFDFRVPIAEWAGSGTVNLGQNDVEYASNYGTTWTAGDSTSFAFGPSGSAVPPSALAAERVRRVRFPTPISASDQITLETSENQIDWFPVGQGAAGISVYLSAGGTNTSGINVSRVAGSSTDVDVAFGKYRRPAATWDGAGADWGGGNYWRLKKVSGGHAVGFGQATATTLGLVKGPVLCSAYSSASQATLVSLTPTKVAMNSEELDSASFYDSATNYRATPNAAGWYRVDWTVRMGSDTANSLRAAISYLYKNGSAVKTGSNVAHTTTAFFDNEWSVGSALVYANGTTDYFEIYALAATTSGTWSILGGADTTYWSMERVYAP